MSTEDLVDSRKSLSVAVVTVGRVVGLADDVIVHLDHHRLIVAVPRPVGHAQPELVHPPADQACTNRVRGLALVL